MRTRAQMSQQQGTSAEDVDLNETVIQATSGPAPPRPSAQADNLNALAASIQALRASIVELRNDTNIQRSDIQQLRQRLEIHQFEQPQWQAPLQPVSEQDIVVPLDTQQSLPPTVSSLPPTTLRRSNPVPVFVDSVATRLHPLPLFDGNPEDWPLFIASYRDTTAEFGYNGRQNLKPSNHYSFIRTTCPTF